jgi:hypothetical protein
MYASLATAIAVRVHSSKTYLSANFVQSTLHVTYLFEQAGLYGGVIMLAKILL